MATSAASSSSSSSGRPRVVHWYRTDLRVHDSPSLAAALGLQPEYLWPVWTWDPAYVYQHRVGPNRWRFLLDSMSELSRALQAIEPAQRLLVLRGSPKEVFEWIFERWEGVTHLVYEIDTSAYARSRDDLILALAQSKGIKVLPVLGHTLYSVPDVVKLNHGQPTMTFAQVVKASKSLPAPARPIPPPETLPPPGPVLLPDDRAGFLGEGWVAPVDLNSAELGGYRQTPPTCFSPSELTSTDVPMLESLALPVDELDSTIPAGEQAALDRLRRLCADPGWVAGFAKPKSSPALAVEDFLEGEMYRGESQGGQGSGKKEKGGGGSTFVLSPFLKFGCLSIRKFHHDTADAIATYKTQEIKSAKIKIEKEPENIHGQLMFREMYICAEYATPNFGRMQGNKICRFIDWKCQTRYDESGAETVPRPKDNDALAEEHLEAWTFGRTGFPWIDALMRQLRQTGWIHHLGRHSVACFLTRGDLYISWERGQEVFDELLLDWDPAANGGNWMWLSCSAFFSMYYRVYSPVTFPVKWDKTGQLVRKFCPELKDFPDKYIYEPWLAPEAVQKKANCIIGKDYPSPIVDHKRAQESTVAKIKSAYSVNLHGADQEVLDGQAEGMLAEAFERIAAAKGNSAQGNVKAVGEKDDEGGESKKRKPSNPFELAKENAEKRKRIKGE